MTPTPHYAAALATCHPSVELLTLMSAPVTAADFIVHAHEARRLGASAMAATLAGRAMDAAERRPFRRYGRQWWAALSEIVQLTGAKRLPSVTTITA